MAPVKTKHRNNPAQSDIHPSENIGIITHVQTQTLNTSSVGEISCGVGWGEFNSEAVKVTTTAALCTRVSEGAIQWKGPCVVVPSRCQVPKPLGPHVHKCQHASGQHWRPSVSNSGPESSVPLTYKTHSSRRSSRVVLSSRMMKTIIQVLVIHIYASYGDWPVVGPGSCPQVSPRLVYFIS